MTETPSIAQRRVLLLAHTGRADAREVARECARALIEHGIAVRLLEPEAKDLELEATQESTGAGWIETVGDDEEPGEGCELALVPNVKHMTFWDGDGALVALQNFLQRHPIH